MCMFHQSESREHRSSSLDKITGAFVFCCIEILCSFFPLSHRCGYPGANATVIFIPQKPGEIHLLLWLHFTSVAQRLVVLEVLEMKGKWEGSVLVRPVYFHRPSARGPLCFSVLPQNTWRQVLGSPPPPLQLLTFPQWFSIRPFGDGTKFGSSFCLG